MAYSPSKTALSRRTFLAGAGTAAAATLVAGCSNSPTPVTVTAPIGPAAPAFTDIDILNFALNLEYLEAEFYLRCATGSGIPAADAGGSAAGPVTGGVQIAGFASLPGAQQAYINTLAQDEYNHVKFLRAALGSQAVPRPAIDLVNSFNTLGNLATNTTAGFNPYGSFNNFLIGGFIFEDVGVTAYHGAAGLLSKGSAYLTPAASILAVEAYHAALLRTLIVATSGPTVVNPAGDQTYVTLADRVASLRASLSGAAVPTERLLSTGLSLSSATATPPNTLVVGPSAVVNSDNNALAFVRSTDAVLHVVYGTLNTAAGTSFGVSTGGFFPAGLNGNIKQTYS